MIISDTRAVQRPPGYVSITPSTDAPSYDGIGTPEQQKQPGLELARHADGKPCISLTLVLLRPPATNENLQPLIESGVLAFEICLSSADNGQKLFARNVSYELLFTGDGATTPIASTQSLGDVARASFSVNLDADQTLNAISALHNKSSPFDIIAHIQYREDGSRVSVTLSGSWQAIHQFIKPHCNNDNTISASALEALIPQMTESGVINVTDDNGVARQLPPDILIRMFMRQSSVILRQLPTFSGIDNMYELKGVPYAGFNLYYSESVKISSMQNQERRASLQNLVGSLIDGNNTDDFIFLVAHEPDDPSKISPVPKKVLSPRVSRDTPGMMKARPVAMFGNVVTSVSMATRPVVTEAIMVKPQPVYEPVREAYLVSDIFINLDNKDRPRNLPIVNDAMSPYWLDRINNQKAWYAPEFRIIAPELNANPATSPFLFSYENIGITSSGKPALKGKLHFQLEKIMSAATSGALTANSISNSEAVPFDSFRIEVFIPFIDDSDGQVKQNPFTATVSENNGVITGDVEFLNDWVRVAYSALSTENQQTLPVEIRVIYNFSCYVRIDDGDLQVVYGAKLLGTPVMYTSMQMVNRSYIDADKLAYVNPVSSVQFKREERGVPARAVSQDRPVMRLPIRPVYDGEVGPIIRPEVEVDPDVVTTVKQKQYATSSQVMQRSVNMLFPCNQYGNFYQQMVNGIPQSIGCQDAFKLGEIKYVQYEEITELRDDDYFSVYRSLAQPGRFVIEPLRFYISRREAGEKDAYRPLIFLNAVIDPVTAANNKVELRSTLQPDIPIFKIAEIKEKLKAYHPSPVISYPTDIANKEAIFTWAVGDTIQKETDMLATEGPFISTYFNMNLAEWELQKSVLTSPGITGGMEVVLADGNHFVSSLLLKLDKIRGPWLNGPLELSNNEDQINITNKTESNVVVSDLVRYAGSTIAEQVPVEATLAQGESKSVTGSAGLTAVFSYPLTDPVAIEETRSFVEDIYSNFVLINLVNFENYDLARLDVEANVEGIIGIHHGTFSQTDRVIDFNYILPLTTYLQTHTLNFRITKIFNGREPELTEWIKWDLNKGPVSITHDLLSL